jgi:hypothetical protein
MPGRVGRMRPNDGFQADVFAAADIAEHKQLWWSGRVTPARVRPDNRLQGVRDRPGFRQTRGLSAGPHR